MLHHVAIGLLFVSVQSTSKVVKSHGSSGMLNEAFMAKHRFTANISEADGQNQAVSQASADECTPEDCADCSNCLQNVKHSLDNAGMSLNQPGNCFVLEHNGAKCLNYSYMVDHIFYGSAARGQYSIDIGSSQAFEASCAHPAPRLSSQEAMSGIFMSSSIALICTLLASTNLSAKHRQIRLASGILGTSQGRLGFLE